MSAFEQNTDYNLILFGHDVLDTDVKVWEAATKVANERRQLRRTANFSFPIAEPICNAAFREQLVYRCLSAFVPYLFEPSANKSFVRFYHDLNSRR